LFSFLKRLIPTHLRGLLRRYRKTHAANHAFLEKVKRFRNVNSEKILDQEYYLSMLRMKTHIVDKGLHSDNWQRGRSKSAYADSKDLLDNLQGCSDPSYEWGLRVVEEYKCRNDGVEFDRKQREEQVPDPIGYELLCQHLKSRTSVRRFVPDKQLSMEDVDAITLGALEAASSCHRQTFRVYCTISPEKVSQVAGCFHGFSCFSSFVPSFWVFCADLRPYSFPAELFTPAVDTALAVQNAVLVAASRGLSMTLLNWAGLGDSEERLRTLLNVPAHEAIIVGGACGFPVQGTIRPARKLVKSALTLF
jgi:nitroreductase